MLLNFISSFRSKFRSLVAGGGTNGGVTYIAEQVNETNSETVYVDFSDTSMKIAQKRAKFRTSLQIVWVIAWIENLPHHGLGKFDFITSTGVLHHLKSPQKGLKVLSGLQLANGGAMISMYGKYARSGIYQIQDLMREIRLKKASVKNELKDSKVILSILPPHHWFRTIKLSDIVSYGDNGIYDLLLHKRDVSFTISSLFEFVFGSGYNVVGFSAPEIRLPTSLKFIINDDKLYDKLTQQKEVIQRSIGELIYGQVLLPDLYISKQENSEANINDEKNVAFAQLRTTGITEITFSRKSKKKFRNQIFAFAALRRIRNVGRKGSPLSRTVKTAGNFGWPISEFNNFVLNTLTRTPMRAHKVHQLITKFNLKQKQSVSFTQGKLLINDLFSYLKETGILYVKNAKIPKFNLTCCGDNFFDLKERYSTLV